LDHTLLLAESSRPELRVGYGGSASFHHDNSAGEICQAGSVAKRSAGRERQCVRRDHGISGSSHVHGLARTDGLDMQWIRIGLDERHPFTAAGYQERPVPQPLSQLLRRQFQISLITVFDAEKLFHLIFVWKRESTSTGTACPTRSRTIAAIPGLATP
jgi:hypothetical protein